MHIEESPTTQLHDTKEQQLPPIREPGDLDIITEGGKDIWDKLSPRSKTAIKLGSVASAALIALGGAYKLGASSSPESTDDTVGTEESLNPSSQESPSSPKEADSFPINLSELEPVDTSGQYESPISGESAPKESWISYHVTQGENMNIEGIETDTVREFMARIKDQTERKVGSVETGLNRLRMVDNLVFFYQINDEVKIIDGAVAFGWEFEQDDDDVYHIHFSRQAEDGFPHYTFLFPTENGWEQFTVTRDPDIRWHSQQEARIVGLFYKDPEAEVSFSPVNISQPIFNEELNAIGARTDHPRSTPIHVFSEKSRSSAWDKINRLYPNLAPVELREINRVLPS